MPPRAPRSFHVAARTGKWVFKQTQSLQFVRGTADAYGG